MEWKNIFNKTKSTNLLLLHAEVSTRGINNPVCIYDDYKAHNVLDMQLCEIRDIGVISTILIHSFAYKGYISCLK